MRAWLQYAWYRLTAGLWLVPVLMMVGAIALSFLTLYLDTLIDIPLLTEPGSGFHIGPEGGRLLLSTIAGSMVTVASLVFSITLVTLQLASSQLGPRLINRFMQDKINQVALGTFIATFTYALFVLRTVGESDEQVFVPHLSIVAALTLAVFSLVWLIYFIHHVAETIQADTVIADVGEELRRSIAGRFPGIEVSEENNLATTMPPLDRLAEPAGEIHFRQSGYIQAIDARALLKMAARHDLIIELHRRPGHFVVSGAVATAIWPRQALTEQLAGEVLESIVIGPRRTSTQDVEFALGSLVQIALRALSPALNDPITAVTCIDRLAAALVEIMRQPPPLSQIPDESGEIRLILYPTTFEGALDTAFNDIRQSARGEVRASIRLVEALTTLALFRRTENQRQAIEKHADILTRVCRDTIQEPADLADAEAALAHLWAAIQGEPRVQAAAG